MNFTFFLLVLCVFLAFCEEGYSTENPDSNDEYLTLALEWPGTKFATEKGVKIPNVVKTWTIHGLWPQNVNEKSCDKSLQFDPKKLKTIMLKLKQFWPNVYPNTPVFGFWKHEWDKHGTCAVIFPEVKGVFKYFSKTIELCQRYRPDTAFTKNKIIPSDKTTYPLSKILNVLKKSLNVNTKAYCINQGSPRYGNQYISRIDICFDKTLKLINCPQKDTLFFVSGRPTEVPCHNKAKLKYPPIKYTFEEDNGDSKESDTNHQTL